MKKTLTEGPILGHIKNIAIPSSIGFLFNTLFNIVDTVYVGRLSTEALAGVTLSFPIFFLIIAFSNGLGQSVTALTGNEIGKNNLVKYYEIIKNAGLVMIALVLFYLVSIWTLIPWLFSLTGASGESLRLGILYTQVIYGGAIFFSLNFFMNGILLAEGNTKPFRNYLMVGFFLNIILNPIFIFGWFGLPRLSTAGVAIATVIVQALGTIYLMTQIKKSDHFQLDRVLVSKVNLKDIDSVILQMVPVSLTNATISLGIFVINYFAVMYGGDVSVAAYGSALRIEQIMFLPTIGLNVAVLSLVAQNFGAKRYDRMKEAIFKSGLIGFAILASAMVMVYLFAPLLMPLLTTDQAVIDTGVEYLRIAVFGFTSYIFINLSVSTLQALKRPVISLFVSLYRQAFPILLFPIMVTTFSLGVRGIWWGIVLTNWSAALLIVPFTVWQFKKSTKTA
jgi:putative MATE family efflux protein